MTDVEGKKKQSRWYLWMGIVIGILTVVVIILVVLMATKKIETDALPLGFAIVLGGIDLLCMYAYLVAKRRDWDHEKVHGRKH